jgi:hypothetical protein
MYPRYRDVPINLAKAVIFSESRKAHPRLSIFCNDWPV